jgi:hypothetical protein
LLPITTARISRITTPAETSAVRRCGDILFLSSSLPGNGIDVSGPFRQSTHLDDGLLGAFFGADAAARTLVLIDDRVDTIREWEKQGGTGILHHSTEETLAKLRELGLL